MNIFRKITSLTLLLILFAQTTYAQSTEECDITTAPAYSDCARVTHLSAYVPVAALVIAAVLLSTADSHGRRHSSNNAHSDYSDSYYSYGGSSYSSSYGSSSGYSSH